MFDCTHELSVVRHRQILKRTRSTGYYVPEPTSAEDLARMRRIEELHLEYQSAGARMLHDILKLEGHAVGRMRVSGLMKKMGIEALYRKPNPSPRHDAHPIYPYLLRNLTIGRPNHVCGTDINYIPMKKSFVYLAVIVDWHSRDVLSWRIFNTLTTDFCIDAVYEAIIWHGWPEIFITNLGGQFTNLKFTQVLKG